MSATVIVRDDAGREYQAAIGADGSITAEGHALRIAEANDGSLHVQGASAVRVWAIRVGATRWVFVGGRVYTFDANRPAARRRAAAAHQEPLAAPMPATVRRIHVAAGDEVRRGDLLVVLEAMKMELPVRAAADGRVRAINCREGEMVQPGQEIVEME